MYVFSGESGYLDHSLANAAIMPYVTGAYDWHINSDEPIARDYQDYNQAYLLDATAFRSSDHDPVLIGLDLSLEAPADFVQTSPMSEIYVRGDAIPAFTWQETNATSYTLNIYRFTGNVIAPSSIGTVLEIDLDSSSVCMSGTCTYTLSAPEADLVTTGSYAWYVEATNGLGTTTASNASFVMYVNQEPIELLMNGSFETNDDAIVPVPDYWTAVNRTQDKRTCNNLVNPNVTSFGECAYLFKGVVGENSRLVQTTTAVNFLEVGDVLNFGAMVKTNVDITTLANIGKVIVFYDDNTTSKAKLLGTLTPGSYALYSNSITLTGNPVRVKFLILNRKQMGRVFVDGASLLVAPPAGLIPFGNGVLGLPDAPDGFKK